MDDITIELPETSADRLRLVADLIERDLELGPFEPGHAHWDQSQWFRDDDSETGGELWPSTVAGTGVKHWCNGGRACVAGWLVAVCPPEVLGDLDDHTWQSAGAAAGELEWDLADALFAGSALDSDGTAMVKLLRDLADLPVEDRTLAFVDDNDLARYDWDAGLLNAFDG